MGGLDPLRVPAAFWQRDEVSAALGVRDIGALFRLLRRYCGASQTQIGIAVGMTQSTVSLIMNDSQQVTAIAVLDRIADGLDMPDQACMLLGLAPREVVDTMRRRTALGIGLMATLSPATVTDVLRDSAAEAVEFTRELDISSVGTGTLDHLSSVIAELDRAYEWQPATKLFPIARLYRRQIASLIKGQHTLREANELYVQGAHLSYLLSDLADDLGSHVAAQAYATDSYRYADQAGHDELCAWASSSLACWALNAGQPAKAVAAAERGMGKAPRRSPVAARLRARAASGYARQGNHSACTKMLADARKLCDQLPDESPSRLATENSALTSCKIAQCGAYSHVQLGDYQQAERLARTALAVAAWSPGSADTTRMDLAIALANLGSPDEAAEHGTQALADPRFLGALLPRARELEFVLTSRYPNEPCAQDFHDQYRRLADGASFN